MKKFSHCFFFNFSVVTYVTDYYSKDETGITEHLRAALKESKLKNMSQKQTLHSLKRVYMTKREIGFCEAVYRVSRDLHLKKSNVQTTFVSSGFPKNISHFLKKMNEDYIDEQISDCSDNEEIVHLDNRIGNFKQSISIQDKYKGRPKMEDGKQWQIILAQFATSYTRCEKIPKR